MWLLVAREPRPDAPDWPGRRLLAAVDAVAWPLMWVLLIRQVPGPAGLVGPFVTALAVLLGLGRLHQALWVNHRYWFTTWRWGKVLGAILLAEMQKIIDAENSDLFDVLAHVAYALAPRTREERAAQAMALVSSHFNSRQQVFLDFVLSHYVSIGVEELDQTKLTPLLKLKYHDSIADAVADLGQPEDIGRVFAGFQKYLYLSTTPS